MSVALKEAHEVVIVSLAYHPIHDHLLGAEKALSVNADQISNKSTYLFTAVESSDDVFCRDPPSDGSDSSCGIVCFCLSWLIIGAVFASEPDSEQDTLAPPLAV